MPKSATVALIGGDSLMGREIRDVFATASPGVNLRLIQDILGHQSPKTTAIYTHLTPQARDTLTVPLRELMKDL